MKNVLFLDWPCFGSVDAIYTLEQQMGYTLTKFFHKDYQERISSDFDNYFSEIIKGKHFKFCFSFNYYPVVAENCKKHDIPYISISFDTGCYLYENRTYSAYLAVYTCACFDTRFDDWSWNAFSYIERFL